MNDLLVCCNPCGCESLVVLDGNAIWITLIICITIIAAILLILYKPSNKEGVTNPNKTDKDNQTAQQKKEELTPEEKEEKKKKEKEEKEEKKKKEFLDYCYTMAKSLEEGNEEQRNDCWKILLYNHDDYVPYELKIKNKVGKNVAGNVSKTE